MFNKGEKVRGISTKWDPRLLRLTVELEDGSIGYVYEDSLTMYENPMSNGFSKIAAYCIGKNLEYAMLDTGILERKVLAKKQLAYIKENPEDIYKGTVTNITPKHVFVDIAGVQGLCNIQELSYARIPHCDWIVTPGMYIPFKILQITEDNKLLLSYKAIHGTLRDVIQQYKPGDIVSARISSRVNPEKDTENTDSYFVLIDKVATGIVDIPKGLEVYIGDRITAEIKKIGDRGIRSTFVNF